VSEEQKQQVTAVVKWYKADKGFGFVRFADGSGEAFLHSRVLASLGEVSLTEGTGLVCDIAETPKGPQVVAIHSIPPADPAEAKPAQMQASQMQEAHPVPEVAMAPAGDATSPVFSTLTSQIASWMGRRPAPRTRFLADQLTRAPASNVPPNVMDVMAGSIDIMQDRITRSRLAGEPPDVLIAPRLAHIGILEFDRAEEVVEIGYGAASILKPALELALRRA